MKMLWQNYPAVDDERMTLTYRSHRVAQQADMSGQQIIILPAQQIYGEEICTARMSGATIVRHEIISSRFSEPFVMNKIIRRNAFYLLRPTRYYALLAAGKSLPGSNQASF
jgi:hypothetical protein